jgi:hypothetical protein
LNQVMISLRLATMALAFVWVAGLWLEVQAASLERVAILGDSITYSGRWAPQVEYALRGTPRFGDADKPDTDSNHYDEVLESYGQLLVSKRADGWKTIDIRPDLRQAITMEKQRNPDFSYAVDNVHSGNEAQDFIAASINRQLWALLQLLGSPIPADETALRLLLKRAEILKHAWLTKTGHARPGVPHGLPMEEAIQKAAELLQQFRSESSPAADP